MWVEIDRSFASPVSRNHAEPAEKDTEIEVVVDPGEATKKAATALEQSLGSIRGAAVALMGAVKELAARDDRVALDDVTLELALSFGVEGGVVVAKGSARAEATVTLTWRAPPRG